MGIGYSFSFLLNFLSIPILARLYKPEDFGSWAIIIGINALIVNVYNFRADIPIVITKCEKNASALFRLSFYMAIITFFIFVFFLLAFSTFDLITNYLIMTFLGMSLLNQNLIAWQNRLGNFGSVANYNIILSFFCISVQLIYGLYINEKSSGLLVGSVVGTISSFFWLVFCHYRNERPNKKISLRGVVKRNIDLISHAFGYSFISNLKERGLIIILSLIVNVNTLGAFSKAWRLAFAPSNLIGNVIRPVFLHELKYSNSSNPKPLFINICYLISVLGGIFLAIFHLYHIEIILFVLGEQWLQSAGFLFWVSLPAYLFCVSSWMDRIFDNQNLAKQNLYFETLVSLIMVALLLFCYEKLISMYEFVKYFSVFYFFSQYFYIYRCFNLCFSATTSLIKLTALCTTTYFTIRGLGVFLN